MSLFSKFRQWHNGGLITPATILPVKPHIYPMYYPKSRRIYWKVSSMPRKYLLDRVMYKRWQYAYEHTRILNNQIGYKIHAERLAKKEKQK